MVLTRFVEHLDRLGPLCQAERDSLRGLPGRYVDIGARQDLPSHLNGSESRVMVVADGLLASCHDTLEGKRQLTALYVPGDLCDLDALVLGAGPNCLTTLTDSRVYAVTRGAFAEVMRQHPGLIRIFWRYCSSRMLILHERVISLGSRDARARLAHLICELLVRYGIAPEANGGSFHLPMTQGQLANVLCLTQVHVNRTLSAMAAEGLLSFRRSTVTVLDRDRLMQVADFDPGYLTTYLPSPATGVA